MDIKFVPKWDIYINRYFCTNVNNKPCILFCWLDNKKDNFIAEIFGFYIVGSRKF